MKLIDQVKAYKSLELHRAIGSKYGFFKVYFEQLKYHKTNADAFNCVNDIYCELFGEYRYDNFESFKSSLKNYTKKQNEFKR